MDSSCQIAINAAMSRCREIGLVADKTRNRPIILEPEQSCLIWHPLIPRIEIYCISLQLPNMPKSASSARKHRCCAACACYREIRLLGAPRTEPSDPFTPRVLRFDPSKSLPKAKYHPYRGSNGLDFESLKRVPHSTARLHNPPGVSTNRLNSRQRTSGAARARRDFKEVSLVPETVTMEQRGEKLLALQERKAAAISELAAALKEDHDG